MWFRLQLCDAREALQEAQRLANARALAREIGPGPKVSARVLSNQQPCQARAPGLSRCGRTPTAQVQFEFPNRRVEWRCKLHEKGW